MQWSIQATIDSWAFLLGKSDIDKCKVECLIFDLCSQNVIPKNEKEAADCKNKRKWLFVGDMSSDENLSLSGKCFQDLL